MFDWSLKISSIESQTKQEKLLPTNIKSKQGVNKMLKEVGRFILYDTMSSNNIE